MIQKTKNFNTDTRNINLLNAFFGPNVATASHAQQMEDDLDDYTINEDMKYNKILQQTKIKLQSSQKFVSFGLDGNLKNEMKYGEEIMFKNELDLEQQHLFEEQKLHQQQELLKQLKPKLLNRFNRLSVKNVDTEDKLIKYKKYLQNYDYFSNSEQYPLKKLKLKSYKCVNKQYIPLVESILNEKINNLIDLSLFNARRFRINWFHPLKYTSLSLLSPESSAIETVDKQPLIFSLTSPNLMLQMKQLNMSCTILSSDIDYDVIKKNCSQYLQIQRDNSVKNINQLTGIPHFKHILGNKIVNDFYNATLEMRNNIGN